MKDDDDLYQGDIVKSSQIWDILKVKLIKFDDRMWCESKGRVIDDSRIPALGNSMYGRVIPEMGKIEGGPGLWRSNHEFHTGHIKFAYKILSEASRKLLDTSF